MNFNLRWYIEAIRIAGTTKVLQEARLVRRCRLTYETHVESAWI